MEYVVGLLLVALVICGIVKAITANSYAEMTSEEYEEEVKKSSHLGPAIMAIQKIVDPNHHVEYVEEEKERIEADASNSGDPPKPTNGPEAM